MRLFRPSGVADRVVPPTGFTARLTLGASAAMAFLAVFALALSLSAGRVASTWSDALARTATVRISAPSGQVEAQAVAALAVLDTTPGVASARRLGADEQRALLEPWFGPDLPIESLPVPVLIEVVATADGFDSGGLSARLAGEAPGAVLDDHAAWRAPLVAAAGRMRLLGFGCLLLISLTVAAMVALAAQAALAANARVIATLRLVGAEDAFIARAFVRRFTLRGLAGAGAGTLAAAVVLAMLPSAGAGSTEAAWLSLSIGGAQWALLLLVPPATAAVAYGATRLAARRALTEAT
ncbi:ABC transporter permease [Tropicimonas sp. IMCC34011]|uniref:cell division protein FtsX n=1 Tax=Tropicimonas sp. IMCC34011 TaxID=2248759 RepID=UPI000E26F42E|nr:cell division protein FtsX [Tropicimonas sp. IMCC34011]